jgi:centromeric protein E
MANKRIESFITSVAIRMRPLNSKESGNARVWRVLSKYNSVTQTTSDGKPLPERTKGRSFFTFDKTFGENNTTKELYDGVAQGIVESVVRGLNGTIFAYGQTSSGKTYTMQGSGTIEEGSSSEGGIVHMAAKDIFSNIRNDPDRVFLLRVSFVEIYNEEVRDLLVSSSSDNVLKIREDPRRGVFVDATENIVTDFQSLLSVLFAGEKNRAFASTAMNERSSRSHTIFRITVESRTKASQSNDENFGQGDQDDDEESFASVDGDDGAVRISTLNLVDLAGSESVRHTGATGDRQKEGGMINQR